MKQLLSVVFISLVTLSIAQMQEVQKNKLELSGQSKLKAKPDQANVSLYVSAKKKTLGLTIQDMEEQTSKIIKRIKSLGFSKEGIKTNNYNVREDYHFLNKKRSKIGYKASQNIMLSFPYDAKKLDKFLTAFSDSDESANLHFSFSLSESKRGEVKDELLELAVKDAKRKAQVIASAAGVELGTVLNIRYDMQNNNYQPQYRGREMAMMKSADGASNKTFSQMDLKEIELSDNISVIWEIK
ncbi:MAG: SIMPL domain-containing protein [Cyclobacteriaceae bacterium]